MNSTPTAMCSNDALVDAYEQLRRHVVDGPSRGFAAAGQAVLVQRGMKAWIDVASSLTSTSSTILPASHRDDVMTSNQRSEIVQVLAAMALHQYLEANP